MKKNHLYLSLFLGMIVGIAVPFLFQPSARAEQQPQNVTPPSRQEDILSSHQTKARYDGIHFIPCRFRTALCPDKCGHSKNVAMFTVITYLDYKKTGEYGDEKQMVFSVDVSSPVTQASFADKVRQTISHLKDGAIVRLDWNHIYVTDKGSSFPERPVTKLEPWKD